MTYSDQTRISKSYPSTQQIYTRLLRYDKTNVTCLPCVRTIPVYNRIFDDKK